MAILVPRQPSVEYEPEVIREPGTRNVGVANVVPQMIREAMPISGLTSGVSAPRLTTQFGTTQGTNINPLAGAALGALMGQMLARNTTNKPIVQSPPKTPPGGGTSGGPKPGGTSGGTKPGGTSGGTGGTSGGGGYTGPVGIFTKNPDGSITQTMDDGSTLTFDQNGNLIGMTEAPEDTWSYDAESGMFYNSATGTYYNPETGTEEFGVPVTPEDSGESSQPEYDWTTDYGYTTGGTDTGSSDYDWTTDYGYNFDSGYDWTNDYGYNFDPGYSYDYGYDYGGFGTGSDYGYDDYFSFFKKGGMATPMMKKGGVINMADGGDLGYSYDLYDYSNNETSDGTTSPIVTTSSDADAQEGGFYGVTPNVYTNPVTGEVFKNGYKIYDPNVGFGGFGTAFRNIADTASGALNSISDFTKSFPGTSGAAIGALLSQILSQKSGGGRENLGVDMSRFGAIAPRTTTFGVGAPRFLSYQQYGSQQPMPEMYGPELYRNLNAPGFNPVNPTRRNEGGLAQMADGGQPYYTYGRSINPADNLASGGQPMMGGGTPMVEGRIDYRHGSAVEGPGDGQSDDIPAMLADGEYVIDAETVAMLGNGSNKAGAKKLDEFRMNIRKHKRDTPLDKIPPASKSPLSYLKGSKNG